MLSFNIQVEKLQKDEYEKAAILLADAFESNPTYALIFAKKEQFFA